MAELADFQPGQTYTQQTRVLLTAVNALLLPLCIVTRCASNVEPCMDDFPIDPPLLVKDTPKPRRLRSLAEARAFIEEEMRVGRPPAWRSLYRRTESVRSEDEAREAIGALRELLELEDLLVPPEMPLVTQPR
jgi:hypothetical protein